MAKYTIPDADAKRDITLPAGLLVDLVNDLDFLGGSSLLGRRASSWQSRLRRRIEKQGVTLSATHGVTPARIDTVGDARELDLTIRDVLQCGEVLVRLAAGAGRPLSIKDVAEQLAHTAGECARLKHATADRLGRILALFGVLAAGQDRDAEPVTVVWRDLVRYWSYIRQIE